MNLGPFGFPPSSLPQLLIQTLDGVTKVRARVLKVTNGSLTDNGDGTATLSAGGGSTSVATDPIWTAKGDLAVGTASGAASALHVGTNGQVLTADSTQATGTKWSTVTGTGTVTSVALTVPSDKSVTGSPITTSGTLAITDSNQSANTVKAGPTSGAATTPSYRSLVLADLPVGPVANKTAAYTLVSTDDTITADATTAGFTLTLPAANSVGAGKQYHIKKTDGSGNAVTVAAAGADTIDGAASKSLSGQYTTLDIKSDGTSKWMVDPVVTGSGTVTSVALSAPSEFTVSGSPVTTSGTLTFAKANQNANLIYAGPSSGAAAAPTFRAMVSADIAQPQQAAGALYAAANFL